MANYKIPFDSYGNMVSYETYRGEYRDNYEFADTLTLWHMARGRSACTACFVGSDGTRYSMFLPEFLKIIQRFNDGDIENIGRITGTWTFRKQGANYSIILKDGGANGN